MNNFIGNAACSNEQYLQLTVRFGFIVGQVTPSMQLHLGFGTFVFFGVSHICVFAELNWLAELDTSGLFLPWGSIHSVLCT